MRSYVSDLGLSNKHNENESKDCIYGVMPYIAPEVLSGRPFTKNADIYTFGVIMSEMSTGQRPFGGYQFNIELALSICNGLRPKFASGTPECYIALAKQCMDHDPEERPLAIEVVDIFQFWIESVEGLGDDEINKQFLDADELIKTLPTTSPSHPDHMYTPKSINILTIVGELKGYGECERCNQNNTSEAWCQTCDPKMETQGWTSGNKNVDNYIKAFQLKALAYTKVIEWIPFDRLSGVKKIGGFGSVYSAIWSDGTRKINYVKDRYVRTREPSSEVALKTLPCFEENSLLSLKEFNNHLKCSLMGIKLKVYGLTQDTKTKEYMMVAHISEELHDIHYAGYIHGDFHSGNILLDRSMRTYISDLGLSKKEGENVSKGEIYGVMPYVAPEVLSGENFTPKEDIYIFGIIMTEMSTGHGPFDGYEFDNKLALKICIEGLRPKFADRTPNCYIKLAKQCTNSNPQIRPTAFNIYNEINNWFNKIKGSDYINEVIKCKIKYGVEGSYNIAKIKKHEIDYWSDKIIVSNNVDEIINQLKYWLGKINYSEDIEKIKKQFNDWFDKTQNLDYVKQIIKHEIYRWLDEIKISENIDKNIKQLKYWVSKINDTEDADRIKKQINDQLDKIKGSDYVNEIIKLKVKCWLNAIKVLGIVNEIKRHEISYWLEKIKGLDDVDEIKKQIKYWLNVMKVSNDLDKIKNQINYWIDKIKGPEKIKKQINYWISKIKGLDNVDEITRQFLESDKIISKLPSLKHTDNMYISKIINTQEISVQ
ncbi:kinase-like domain-containing protein [Gigaspora rosea]|uniref:Kinase-like domain-containing protein n=1 Tax=Gigaspora rosea TaxID=44941 RepID=A0A397UJK4_9GLOM|nr:kinase-like domain-containing protein [Gigaspora rosea]